MSKIDAKQRLSAMIDSYQDLILSVCYRMTGDYFAAQDLTQETFIAAYRNLPSILPDHEKGWLAKTASNKCIDYIRRQSHEPEAYDPETLPAAADPADTESRYLEQDTRDELLRMCSMLNEPYQGVAYRYYYLEQSIEEIAAELNEKPSAVKTRVYRARDRLRWLYRNKGSGPGLAEESKAERRYPDG